MTIAILAILFVSCVPTAKITKDEKLKFRPESTDTIDEKEVKNSSPEKEKITNLSYPLLRANYLLGAEIKAFPAVSGTPERYQLVSGQLPAGIRLNPKQGSLEGVSTQVTPVTRFIIEATDGFSSSLVALSLEITLPPPPPTPAPTPKPTPAPTPKPTPAPTPKPTPAPEPTPTRPPGDLTVELPIKGQLFSSKVRVKGTCVLGLPISFESPGLSMVDGSLSSQGKGEIICKTGQLDIMLSYSGGDGERDLVLKQTIDDQDTLVRINVVRDSIKPLLSHRSPIPGQVSSQQMTLEGDCEGTLPLKISGDILPVEGIACQNGKYKVDVSLTAQDGPKSIQLQSEDLAGNSNTLKLNFILGEMGSDPRWLVVGAGEGGHRVVLEAPFEKPLTEIQDEAVFSHSDHLIRGFTFAGDKIVFVGGSKYGFVRITYDGVTWPVYLKQDSKWLADVAYDGKKFVVVGGNGQYGWSNSSEGLVWNFRKAGVGSLRSVEYGGGRFFAVGDDGLYGLSTNGIDWNFVTEGPEFSRITYGNGRFVGFRSGRMVILRDGETRFENGDAITAVNNITFDGERFIAVRGKTLYFSTDGLNWTSRTTKLNISKLAYVKDGQYVAFRRDYGQKMDTFYKSSDLENWVKTHTGPTNENSNRRFKGGVLLPRKR